MGREDGGGKPPHEGGITPDEAKRLGDLLTGPDTAAADPLGLGSPPPPGTPQVPPTPSVGPPKAAQPPKPPAASPGAPGSAKSDDHERILREAAQQQGRTPGGVTDADVDLVAKQLVDEDFSNLDDEARGRRGAEGIERDRQQAAEQAERDAPAGPRILDSIDSLGPPPNERALAWTLLPDRHVPCSSAWPGSAWRSPASS